MALRVGVLTDLHQVQDTSRRAAWINSYDFAGVADRLERALELFAGEGVDRVLLLGDLAHDGDVASLRQMLAPAASRASLEVVGGNHDSPDPTSRISDTAGGGARLPGWRAVGPDSVRLAGLRIARRSRPGERTTKEGSSHAERRWGAARRPAFATWGAAPVLLASHFPVISRARELRERGLPYAGDLLERAEIEAALLARGAPTVVVCGHLHVRDSVVSGSLLQLCQGALVEPPFDATVLAIEADGGGVEVVRHAHELGRAAERREPRLTEAKEAWRFEPGRGWRRS